MIKDVIRISKDQLRKLRHTPSLAQEALGKPIERLVAAIHTAKDDTGRILEAGAPSVLLGGPAALFLLPFAPLTVPLALSHRVAQECETPFGKVLGGLAGLLGGIWLGLLAKEFIYGFHLFEVLNWSARTYERMIQRQKLVQLRRRMQPVAA